MSILPAGVPAWVRTNDPATYGGQLEKKNYQSQGMVNPRTDVDATQFVRLCEDMAALARTAPLAVLRYTTDDTGMADPTVHSCIMMSGVHAVDYDGGSPPAGFPTVLRNGDGDVTITFTPQLADAYGITADIDLQNVGGSVHGVAGDISPTLLDPDVNTRNEAVQIEAFDSAGAALTDVTVSVELWT